MQMMQILSDNHHANHLLAKHQNLTNLKDFKHYKTRWISLSDWVRSDQTNAVRIDGVQFVRTASI